jgi:hypothetical protein
MILLQIEPTFGSLPIYSIVTLVAAVSALFALIVKGYNERLKNEREDRIAVQKKLDASIEERISELKKWGVILNENIQLVNKLTGNEKDD